MMLRLTIALLAALLVSPVAGTLAASGPPQSAAVEVPRLTMSQAREAARAAHATLAGAMTSKVGAQAPVVIPACQRRSRTLIVCRVVVQGEQQVISDRTFVRAGKCCFRYWVRDIRTAAAAR